MIHGWLETAHGFPPVLAVSGGPLGGRTFSTLAALLSAAQGTTTGRETYRLWCRDADALYFLAKAEGICPPLSILPGHGVTGLTLSRRVQIRAARHALSDQVLEQMAQGEHSPAEGLGAVADSLGALERALAVEASGGIGAATTAALFGGRWMPRYCAWPDTMTEADGRLCRDAYHGGMTALFHQGAILESGAAGPADTLWRDGPPSILPHGWTLAEVDRDSAYAEDAAGDLPDTLSAVVRDPARLMDCAGGAIVDATVNLMGFRAVGFPVRLQVAQGITRGFSMRVGAWRGAWCSDLIRWAVAEGATVQIHGGLGWTRKARFLGPLMDRLWKSKHQLDPGPGRDACKAAIQRAVGRLGRRRYSTVTLWGAEAMHEVRNPEEWATKWSRIHGHGAGYFVADAMSPPEGEPHGAIPAWPSFVVSRAWIRLARQMEAAAGKGAWPLYADTDGFLAAWPPDSEAMPAQADAMGAWRVKRHYVGAEHRDGRAFARLAPDGSEHLQMPGVRKADQRAALMGLSVPGPTGRALDDLRNSMRLDYRPSIRDIVAPYSERVVQRGGRGVQSTDTDARPQDGEIHEW